MAFQAMVTGKITVAPTEKISKNGNKYVFALMSCPTHNDYMSVSIFAFDDEVKSELLALNKSDEVAMSGSATISEWDDKGTLRFSLTLNPTKIMTMYHYRKTAKAIKQSKKEERKNLDFDDDIDDIF